MAFEGTKEVKGGDGDICGEEFLHYTPILSKDRLFRIQHNILRIWKNVYGNLLLVSQFYSSFFLPSGKALVVP